MIVRHLLIHGRVQGVGFRASLAWEAQRLGITGWVRNRREGTVEAVACGAESDVQRLIDWAHRGPTMARVTQVDVSPTEGEFTGFEQRSTA